MSQTDERAAFIADASYGHGHDQASGGALPFASWNEFVRGPGFDDELEVGPT